MYLDCVANQTSVPEQEPIPKRETCKTPKTGPKLRVLVADDHTVFRKSLIQLLKEIPELEVIADAQDGQQAVELTVLLRPDVVIMDVEMPRMNGIEATRKIKSICPHVRIIGVSMHPYGEVESRIIAAGAVQYFPKGDPVEELLSAIQC